MEREKSFSPEEEELKLKFPLDAEVKVKRSSGVIEDGWHVLNYVRGTNNVLCAVVYSGEGKIGDPRKTIPLTKLVEYN